jgi:hypothetical protein
MFTASSWFWYLHTRSSVLTMVAICGWKQWQRENSRNSTASMERERLPLPTYICWTKTQNERYATCFSDNYARIQSPQHHHHARPATRCPLRTCRVCVDANEYPVWSGAMSFLTREMSCNSSPILASSMLQSTCSSLRACAATW